jgi:hypothetical protein
MSEARLPPLPRVRDPGDGRSLGESHGIGRPPTFGYLRGLCLDEHDSTTREIPLSTNGAVGSMIACQEPSQCPLRSTNSSPN